MQLEIKIDLNSQPTKREIAAALNQLASDVENNLLDDLEFHPAKKTYGNVVLVVAVEDGE